MRTWKEKCKELDETYKELHVTLNGQTKGLREMEEGRKAMREGLSCIVRPKGSL